MGLFDFMRRERRSRETITSADPYLSEFFGMRGSGQLAAVSADQALSNIAVAIRCVAVRSELLASMPLHVFRRDGESRRRAVDHPLYGLLHDQPNDLHTAFEARELLIRSLDLSGNAYAEILRDGRGNVVQLVPLPPFTVGVERLPSGRLRYRVTTAGGSKVLLQDEVLHIRGASRDGVLGMSALQMGAGAVSLRVAQAETAANLAANGLKPSGVMTFPERLKPEQQQQVRDNIASKVQGVSGAGEVLIMDGGAKFERMTFSPEDAEFLASMKAGNEDICRLFGVPPTVAGITDRATYSNTEQEGRALVQNCLGPLAKRVESAMARCLLTPDERADLYIEHDLSALLRGDVQARFEAYRIGREIGVYSPNDIRQRENESPIQGGDTYAQPANWTALGSTQGNANAGA